MQTYYHDATEANLPHYGDLNSATREDLIAWHVWNDPNGCWTDDDREAENLPPLFRADVMTALINALRFDMCAEGNDVYRVIIHAANDDGEYRIVWTGEASSAQEAQFLARDFHERTAHDVYTIAATSILAYCH